MSKLFEILAQSGVNAVNNVRARGAAKAADETKRNLDLQYNLLNKEQNLNFDSSNRVKRIKGKNASDTKSYELNYNLLNNIPSLEAEINNLRDGKEKYLRGVKLDEFGGFSVNEIDAMNKQETIQKENELFFSLGLGTDEFKKGVIKEGYDPDKIKNAEQFVEAKKKAEINAQLEVLNDAAKITKSDERAKLTAKAENIISNDNNLELQQINAAKNGEVFLDLATNNNFTGSRKFIKLPTLTTQPYNNTTPIMRKGNATALLQRYGNEISGDVYRSLNKGQQTMLDDTIGRFITAIYEGTGSIKENESGEEVFVMEGQKSFDFSSITNNSPDWVKNAIKQNIKKYSGSGKTATLYDNEVLELPDELLDVNKKSLERVYGSEIVTEDSIPVLTKNHVTNSIRAYALNDGNGVTTPNLQLVTNKFGKEAIKIGNSSLRVLQMRGLDAYGDLVYKPNSISLLGDAEYPSNVARSEAIDKGNLYAYAIAYTMNKGQNFASEKGGNYLTIDPRTFYSARIRMYASLFNQYNLAESMEKKQLTIRNHETDETKDLSLVGVPSQYYNPQSGSLKINIEQYKNLVDSAVGVEGYMDKTINLATEASKYGNAAMDTGYFLLSNLDKVSAGGSLFIGAVEFVAQVQAIPDTFRSILFGSKDADIPSWLLDTAQVEGKNYGTDLYDEIEGYIGKATYSKKNKAAIDASLQNLKGFLSSAENNQRIKNGLQEMRNGNFGSDAAKFAQLAIAQASFVFQAAAALQGEGGKAISDGDRKYVEDASKFGLLSRIEDRKAAVAEFMRIIAKANAVNNSVLTAVTGSNPNVGLLHAALTSTDEFKGIGNTILTDRKETELIAGIMDKGLIDKELKNIPMGSSTSKQQQNQGAGVETELRIGKGKNKLPIFVNPSKGKEYYTKAMERLGATEEDFNNLDKIFKTNNE
jgi:hypothetical protein